MANFTSNYKLKKPLPEEFYNIEDHNNNMDIIDAQLKELSDKGGSVKSVNSQTGDVVLSAKDLNVYSKDETNNMLNDHTHTPSAIGAAPMYTYSTTDIVAGTTSLETGKLYLVYE